MANQSKVARDQFTSWEQQLSSLIDVHLHKATSMFVDLAHDVLCKPQISEGASHVDGQDKTHMQYLVVCDGLSRLIRQASPRVLYKHQQEINQVAESREFYVRHMKKLEVIRRKAQEQNIISLHPTKRRRIGPKTEDHEKNNEQVTRADYHAHIPQKNGTLTEVQEKEEKEKEEKEKKEKVVQKNGTLTEAQKKEKKAKATQKKEKELQQFYARFASLAPYFSKLEKKKRKKASRIAVEDAAADSPSATVEKEKEEVAQKNVMLTEERKKEKKEKELRQFYCSFASLRPYFSKLEKKRLSRIAAGDVASDSPSATVEKRENMNEQEQRGCQD
ncbi:hypothetical protein PVAG01_02604 [Phlyctema vagabunda]|uniref:Uncharacterized protein n=1 Tax=Phlyctema vagabunda TaxID=108571 RepID=A0ABR4PRK5_9HELO